MSYTAPKLTIEKKRGWFAIYAGKSKLSKGFRSESDCQAHLERYDTMYQYWAESAGVQAENTDPVIINV